MWRRTMTGLGGRVLSLPWTALFYWLRPARGNHAGGAAWRPPPFLLYLQHPGNPLGKHRPLACRAFTFCHWLDSGLWPGELQGWSRGWACDSTKASEHHAQGFGSNSWPQVIFPMRGKRPCKNGTSLKEKGRVEQGREMGACRYCVSHGTQASSEPERPCTSQLHATIDPLFAEAAWIVFPPSR